jgi:hypothetical protein
MGFTWSFSIAGDLMSVKSGPYGFVDGRWAPVYGYVNGKTGVKPKDFGGIRNLRQLVQLVYVGSHPKTTNPSERSY